MNASYLTIKVLKIFINNYLNHKFSKFPLYSKNSVIFSVILNINSREFKNSNYGCSYGSFIPLSA